MHSLHLIFPELSHFLRGKKHTLNLQNQATFQSPSRHESMTLERANYVTQFRPRHQIEGRANLIGTH